MKNILQLALLLLAMQFVGGPILVRFTNRQPAKPKLEPLVPAGIPPEALSHLNLGIEALRSVGFELLSFFRVPIAGTPGLYSALLLNRTAREGAITVFFRNQTLQLTYAEFSTRFSDGFEVCTNNSSQLAATKPDPLKMAHSFPAVRGIPDLYQIHRRLVESHAGMRHSVLSAKGNEIQEIEEGMVKGLSRQVEFGWMYLDAPQGCYRPTWKGAFLMTWKLCWPVSAIRKALQASENKKILHHLGMD